MHRVIWMRFTHNEIRDSGVIRAIVVGRFKIWSEGQAYE